MTQLLKQSVEKRRARALKTRPQVRKNSPLWFTDVTAGLYGKVTIRASVVARNKDGYQPKPGTEWVSGRAKAYRGISQKHIRMSLVLCHLRHVMGRTSAAFD